MKHSNILSRLHARLGDFWWYSLMIFMAARAADGLNVFATGATFARHLCCIVHSAIAKGLPHVR